MVSATVALVSIVLISYCWYHYSSSNTSLSSLRQFLPRISIFGIPNVNAPALGPDCPSALDRQIDRLADLILAAIRWRDEVTRMEIADENV